MDERFPCRDSTIKVVVVYQEGGLCCGASINYRVGAEEDQCYDILDPGEWRLMA